MLGVLVNYAVWYIMVFFSMVWLIAFLRNRGRLNIDPNPPEELPSVSVVVPAYNEEDVIEDTVQSLLNLNYPDGKLEVIVVDDGSEDSTLGKARKFEPDIKVLTKDENRGKAHSLNMGIEEAKGEIVGCLDADSFVEEDTLMKMVGYFKDEEVGAVTPALKVKNKTNPLSLSQYVEYLMNIFMRKAMSFLDMVIVAPGPFSLYRKEAVKDLGGFDEENITEDMEIALKIHDGGYKIESTTNGEVYTLCPEKIKELYRQRLRWYRGVIYNSIKYRHMFFNSRYGNLGLFFLPMNFISVFLIMFVFANLGYNFFKSIFTTFSNFSAVGFDILPFVFNMEFLPQLDIFLLDLSTVLFAAIAITGAITLWVSFKKTDEEVSQNKGGFVIYLLLYPLLLMAFWTISIVYELLNMEHEW